MDFYLLLFFPLHQNGKQEQSHLYSVFFFSSFFFFPFFRKIRGDGGRPYPPLFKKKNVLVLEYSSSNADHMSSSAAAVISPTTEKKKIHKKKSCCSDLLSPTRLCILFELCGNEQLHRSWGVESLLPIPSSQPPSRAMTFKVKYWHGSPLSAWQRYNFPCGFGRIRHHGGVT